MPLATNLSSSASAETWAVAVAASAQHAAIPANITATSIFLMRRHWF